MSVFVPTSPLKAVFISRWNVAGAENVQIGTLQNSKCPPGVEKTVFCRPSSLKGT